jgi:hypothetical protein
VCRNLRLIAVAALCAYGVPVDGPGRLAQLVWRRRTELGLSRLQVKERGGPSIPTLSDIEQTTVRTVSASTLGKLDVGLGWQPGSAAEILNGGDPRPLEASDKHQVAQATHGPDVVQVGVSVIVELLAVSQDLETLAVEHTDIPELQKVSGRFASALQPIYGEYVTGLFEANRREHGVLSPVFSVFGRLLDETNDSDDPVEREERSYRRWLAGREQELTSDEREHFERRFSGGEKR